MLERIRKRTRPGSASTQGRGTGPNARQKRLSRHERELRQRRLLYIFTAITGAIVIAALLGGALYQYWIYPRQDLASVDGTAIERRDYWQVRQIQLRQQISQFAQQIQFVDAEQGNQLRQRIQLAQDELNDVQGAPIESDTLGSMVDDLVVLKSADALGITVTDAEMEQFMDEQFAPVPLVEPTPTSTVEPTAAAWATGTADAAGALASQTAGAAQTATAEAASPTAGGTGTPDASATGTPGTTGTAAGTSATSAAGSSTTTATETAVSSPTGSGSATVEGSPTVGTPAATETATPNAEQALATSESTFKVFKTNFLDPSDMSRSDYKRLIVRPTLARQKIRDQLLQQVPARVDQVRAAHILVATREAADAVVARLATEEFEAVAREVSTDTSTAPNGGDLGWFPRELMVAPFADAAFALEPGQVSGVVQSSFGFHIIKVYEKEANRPVTLATLQTLRGNAFQKWLDAQRPNFKIKADITLPNVSTTTQDTVFEAPPDAPPLSTATPAPTPTIAPAVEGSPGAGTPETTPETTPTP